MTESDPADRAAYTDFSNIELGGLQDDSAFVNAAMFKTTHGRIDLGTAPTFDYEHTGHFKRVTDAKDALPGDVVVFHYSPTEGHTEIINHYNPQNNVLSTAGSHSQYGAEQPPTNYSADQLGEATIYRHKED